MKVSMRIPSPCIYLHFILLLSAGLLAGADDEFPAIFLTICGGNQTQSVQAFDVNFIRSMDLIHGNITESGFGTGVYGANNTVYGLGQCFEYLSSTDCQLCYSQGRLKLPRCPPAMDSRIYLDGCFLRYANFNMSGQAVDIYDRRLCGNSSVAASVSQRFSAAVNGLVSNLTAEAYNDTDHYKVASAGVAPGVTVYGMAQCWKSLNASACKTCLESARKNVTACLPAADGKALNAGCYLRYSTDPFYLVDAPSGGGSSGGRRLGVALGCVFGSLIVIGIAIFWIRRRRRASKYLESDGSEEFIKSISGSSLSFKYEDLMKATDDFHQTNKLGQGGYGSVYKGILPDGREIAVKRLFFNTRQWVDQFFNEVSLISQVQHKNLVKLLGCSVEGPESLLVYEYLCNTSLDHFLFDSFKKSALDWERRFEIIVGTAEGINYLHSGSEVRIIHRDVKASNVLLDEKFKPKLADFGLARNFADDQSHLSTGVAGTFGYIAPEYIVHGQLTEKADVYSYGVLVFEILTGRKNHYSTASEDGRSLLAQLWHHYNSQTLMEMLDPYLQGQCPEEEVMRVFHIGLLCTQASPNARPPMWKVVEMLISRSRDLPAPNQPPFMNIKGGHTIEGFKSSSSSSSTYKDPVSVNQMSVSVLYPR